MAVTQSDKATRFRALHQGPGAFLIPNPWDAGSARILAGLGFEALATSSGASAGILGRRDGKVTREEALAHARAIVGATDLPVSADLEKGFGDAPAVAAETIRLAAEVGLVGGSIEDASGDKDKPLYDLSLAAERVAAAVQAARALPFPFPLTAWAENFLRGNPNLDDTIKRLQAFEKAGADVLFAPGLPDLEAVRAVCAAVSKPFNFMVGIKGKSFTVAELTAKGTSVMKITAIDTFTLRIPTAKPIALDLPEHRLVVTRIHSDAGSEGLGYSLVFGGSGSEAVEAYARRLAELLIGEDPLLVGRLWDKMYRADRGIRRVGIAGYALSALDIALWDLAGKTANLPLAKLWGATTDRVDAYGSGGWGSYSLDDLIGEATKYAAAGCRYYKMKVHHPDPRV